MSDPGLPHEPLVEPWDGESAEILQLLGAERDLTADEARRVEEYVSRSPRLTALLDGGAPEVAGQDELWNDPAWRSGGADLPTAEEWRTVDRGLYQALGAADAEAAGTVPGGASAERPSAEGRGAGDAPAQARPGIRAILHPLLPLAALIAIALLFGRLFPDLQQSTDGIEFDEAPEITELPDDASLFLDFPEDPGGTVLIYISNG